VIQKGPNYRAEVLHGCTKAQQCFIWLSTSDTSQRQPLLFLDTSSDMCRAVHAEPRVLHGKRPILVTTHTELKLTFRNCALYL